MCAERHTHKYIPNSTTSTMNHHGPKSLANRILLYAEKVYWRPKIIRIIYSNIFSNPPPVFPIKILFAKISRYLGQPCISPCLIKLPLFAIVDVTLESHIWAAQVLNREVLPYIKNVTENSCHGKYCRSKCFAPPFLLVGVFYTSSLY